MTAAIWATPAQALAHWTDAAAVPAPALATLLGIAQDVATAYAPAIADTDPVPPAYMLATVYQARELWAASKREGDVIGLGDGYALRSRPLTGVVRQLLRPTGGSPVFG